MSPLPTAEFLIAFQQRRAACLALLDLSRRQAALIAQEDFHQMIDVLKSKQGLLDHMSRMSAEQQPLRTAWSALREQLPPHDRRRCETLLAETEALLAELLSEERSSSNQLLARRDATQRELQALAVGVQAQQAYQSRPSPVRSRIDLDT